MRTRVHAPGDRRALESEDLEPEDEPQAPAAAIDPVPARMRPAPRRPSRRPATATTLRRG
jgi:hypothetical protein